MKNESIFIRRPRRFAEGDRVVVTADASDYLGTTGEVVTGDRKAAVVRREDGTTIVVRNGEMARTVR